MNTPAGIDTNDLSRTGAGGVHLAAVLSALPALAPQHRAAHTMLTGLLDRSAPYGVLAQIEGARAWTCPRSERSPPRRRPGMKLYAGAGFEPGTSAVCWRVP